MARASLPRYNAARPSRLSAAGSASEKLTVPASVNPALPSKTGCPHCRIDRVQGSPRRQAAVGRRRSQRTPDRHQARDSCDATRADRSSPIRLVRSEITRRNPRNESHERPRQVSCTIGLPSLSSATTDHLDLPTDLERRAHPDPNRAQRPTLGRPSRTPASRSARRETTRERTYSTGDGRARRSWVVGTSPHPPRQRLLASCDLPEQACLQRMAFLNDRSTNSNGTGSAPHPHPRRR